MSNYQRYKHAKLRSNLIPRSDADTSRLLDQVADYIRQADTRFDEVAHMYLEGLTISDLQYMHPEDLINVVPPEHYSHRLLMSILVRRYLFRDDDEDCNFDITQPSRDVISDSSNHSSNSNYRRKCNVPINESCKCSKCTR